ncbi:mannitol-1-phosphate 5-dehydrogenase [Kocuria sp.]|jgi:mannitol-1-phosphate 5-dehydrogenase|uniref:mannitol-1-phosphate 5-dehydrogenase n=1 Tax=Kocuria sp. TaxID=1871328 RepID=UPI002811BDA5|nr:mannitol-1-phosphate 5-dehydrogenase [Kocuria sp.]HST72495.1 mannitol-1-phosphate 5-dehydrogenase [Kocuria rosea]
MKCVHFGAGNIGRGFVGLLMHRSGYEVVFADVAVPLIEALQTTPSYTVHEVGAGSRDTTVDGYRAVNSAAEPEAVVAEIATADVVTTAVGPNVLKFLAPLIARGLAARAADAAPVAVMACENAISATDLLAEAVREHYEGEDLDRRAVFANTAVDRIVPQQEGAGLDVVVEQFHEWVIDRSPFGGQEPPIEGATYVDDLIPYIERKLFTVNTGHAAAAYFGHQAGKHRIAEAVADPSIRSRVAAALGETQALLVAKHGFDPQEHAGYVQKILGRFANEHLPDTVERVGRAPLRKLGRHERFVGPAAALAERGMGTEGLRAAMAAALRFDAEGDPDVARLGEILDTLPPAEAVQEITGLAPEHPLFPPVEELVAAAAQERRG